MNLITEIKQIIDAIDVYVKTKRESPELIYQLKLLNGKIELLKNEVASGKIQDEFEKSFDRLRQIQYSIHHQLLFGPLSRILGLLDLIEQQIESHVNDNNMDTVRLRELNTMSHLITKEIANLKEQVKYILDGSKDIDGNSCKICGKKNKK